MGRPSVLPAAGLSPTRKGTPRYPDSQLPHWVPGAAVTKHCRGRGFEQWKLILSQLWGLEVHNQDVLGVGSSWG